MTIRKILTEPNRVLRQISKPVETVGKEEQDLMNDMLETMYAANGIGLAAIQVGIPKRIIVIDLKKDNTKNPMYYLNPILKQKNSNCKQKNQKSTLEDICYNISSKVISRSTIQNLLKEGVQLNFLEKEVNEKDKREKFYKYTNEAKKITQEWFEEQKKVFLNLNDLNFK